MHGLSVVTGAFGYTGRYIARRLLSMGTPVKTLTGNPQRPNPFGQQVGVAPLSFHDPTELARNLEGADVLYNTYWIRFPRGPATFETAVENTKTLVRAAEEAGVRRIVNVSIANASASSPLPYFRGKGLVEEAVKASTLSYAIVRPTVIFGTADVLINNIAWSIRRLPVFPIFGSGDYRLQPVYVDDVAELSIGAALQSDNVVMDAVGPEVFTYDDMVRLIAQRVGGKARLVHLRPELAYMLTKLLGYVVKDVVLTRNEVDGLMAGLLVSQGAPTGKTSLSEWLSQHSDTVGARYTSELRRHYR